MTMNKSILKCQLSGNLIIPPSKSDGQRAILAAALSKGTSRISNIGQSDDVRAMLSIVEKLGASIQCDTDNCTIAGSIQWKDDSVVNCQESGLATRLMLAQAAVAKGKQTITGSGSILKRSQQFILNDFERWGIDFTSNNGALPITVSGTIEVDKVAVNASESSQFVSGILMAIPLLKKNFVVSAKNATSLPYIAMTVQTLKQFGVEFTVQGEDYLLSDKSQYTATDYVVEGDWSAASFWIVANALGHRINLKGLNPDTFQADQLVLSAVQQAGSQIQWTENGLTVSESKFDPFIVDCTNAPDLFPPLVALAVNCKGISQIKGVHRLLNKESDRAATLVGEFSKLGADLKVEGDLLLIQGGNSLFKALVTSHNDHRIAMSLAIAGTKIDGGLDIEQAESVAKSYPTFWEHFDQLIEGAH